VQSRNILLLDIDDTIIISKDNYIYKTINGKEIALTPHQFAQETVKDFNNYNYRDFEDPKKIIKALIHGVPIIKTLNYMSNKINEGWEVGILTARSHSKLIRKIMRYWLLYKNKEGIWVEIGNRLKKVYAIGKIGGLSKRVSPVDLKIKILLKTCKHYDNVIFIDDDQKYIEAANKLKINNLTTINTKDI